MRWYKCEICLKWERSGKWLCDKYKDNVSYVYNNAYKRNIHGHSVEHQSKWKIHKEFRNTSLYLFIIYFPGNHIFTYISEVKSLYVCCSRNYFTFYIRRSFMVKRKPAKPRVPLRYSQSSWQWSCRKTILSKIWVHYLSGKEVVVLSFPGGFEYQVFASRLYYTSDYIWKHCLLKAHSDICISQKRWLKRNELPFGRLFRTI